MFIRYGMVRSPEGGAAGSSSSAGAGDPAGALLDRQPSGAPASAESPPTAQPGQPADSDWFGSLPEDIRGDPGFAKFAGKTPDEVARAYLNAQKLIGKDPGSLVDLKAAEADPLAVLRRLGAPDKPDAYDLKAPEGVRADLVQQASSDLSWFKQAAVEAGLLPKQAQALFDAALKASQAGVESSISMMRGQEEALQREFGQAFDAKLDAANHAATELGIKDALIKAGLGSHPEVIKALARVGEGLGGAVPAVREGNRSGGLTPAEADAKANGLLREAMQISKTDRRRADELTAEANRYFRMLGA